MAKTKKITKTIAAVMSFALAFGAAGNFPLKNSTMLQASSTYDDFYGLDSVEMKEVMLKRINLENGYIEICLKNKYGYYDRYESKTIYLSCLSSSYKHGCDYYYTEEGEVKKTEEQYIKEDELLSKLEEGDVVNIRFSVPKFETEEYANLEEYIDDRNSYYAFCVTAVRSPIDHLYGDINDDGVIDSFDVINYRKYIADNLRSELSKDMFLNADINQDEVIDEDDLRQVIDFTLGKTTEFNSFSLVGSVRLDNTVDVLASEGTKTDDKFAAAEMNFGVEMLKRCYDKDKNLLISPVSISTALAMTANGADGDTRKEMEKVLGGDLTLDQFNEYISYYAAHLPKEQKEKAYIANSIWFKDAENFKVYDEFLKTNKKFYNSEIYKTDFTDNTVKAVNSWVNRNTNGMIPSLVKKEDMNPFLRMMLINTLYFEAEWQRTYKDSYTTYFTDINGKKHDVEMMGDKEYLYYDLGDADAFKKPYVGNYSFVGILPHEDIDFNEYIDSLDASKLSEGLKESEDPETFELNVTIPKFKYSYSKTLKEVLSEMGMPTAFDPLSADFSKINDLTVQGAEPLYIGNVLHKTKIEVNEKGTKAAAVTAVMMEAGCPPPTKRIINIYLDRPFVYMIVDENNVPAFIGAVTSLDKE